MIFIDFKEEKEILGIVSSWKIWGQGEICALLNIFIEVTLQSVKLNFFYSVYKPDLPEAFIWTLRKLLTQCLLSHWSPKAEVSVDCQKAGIAGFLVSLEPFKGNDWKAQGRELSLVLLNAAEPSFKWKPKYVSIRLCFSFLSGCQNVTSLWRVLWIQNMPYCGCPVGQMIRTVVVVLCEQLFPDRASVAKKRF